MWRSADFMQALAAAAPIASPAASVDEPSLLMQFVNQPIVWLGLKVAFGLLLVVVGVRVGRWTANLERRVLMRAHVDQILAEFLRNLTYALLLALIFITALEFTGFPTTSLFAVLGAAGLAIGLALKDSLSHIAAGVVLIVLRPFRVGDKVNIGGQEGIIDGVFIFQTHMHTEDNRDIVFMNGAVIAAPIFNYSQRETRRADITLPLAHAADLHAAFDAAKAAAAADPRILDEPAPAFTLADISDRAVLFSVQVWSKSAQSGDVRAALLLQLHEQLNKRGVALAQYAGLPPPK